MPVPLREEAVGHATHDLGPRSVVDRALSILAAFHGTDRPLSLSDISRRCSLPIATCYRIVLRLVNWGALERDEDNHYRIGLRLWEIASLAPRSVGLQRIARPHLLALYEATGCAAHLAVREGAECVSIDRIQNPRRPTARPRTGNRYPMHPTAIGLVLLAHAPDDIRGFVMAGNLDELTPRTTTAPDELLRELDRIRTAGYAITDRQVDHKHVSVAAPVRSRAGEVVAAVSLSYEFDGKTAAESLVPIVCHAASQISRAIARRGAAEAA
ncbi:IclR family transcriptional regulator [Pseudoclavibacter endophyticus]|nr:IclR family transcriptional regulator [Pseudoclavibacter endophyticus]